MNDVSDDKQFSILQPVRQASRSDTAYHALRNAIVDGELEPGQRLRAEDLAQSFRISATPVREALARLEQARLVKRIPYKGTFVSEIAPKDFPKIYAVLKVLQGLAAELATPYISDETLTELDELAESALEQMNQGQFDLYFDFDAEFHRAIVESSDNQWVVRALETLNDQLCQIRFVSAGLSGEELKEALDEHCAVLRALRERNADKACLLMRYHIERAEARVLWFFKHNASNTE